MPWYCWLVTASSSLSTSSDSPHDWCGTVNDRTGFVSPFASYENTSTPPPSLFVAMTSRRFGLTATPATNPSFTLGPSTQPRGGVTFGELPPEAES